MRVNDFKWVKGENDYEYIQLLEAECKRKDEIISRAINKLKADRKTEPNLSEIPSGSTISKMEQVDKDTNVRSKDENCSEKPNNCELQTIRCPKCGRTDYIRDMEKDMGIKGSRYKYKCINCNTYIKDEPQTEREGE